MTEEIKEPTAFYRETAIAQSLEKKHDFPVKEVYDAVCKAMLPYLFERQLQPRSIATTMLMVVFDTLTTAMASTDYEHMEKKHGVTYESDMQGFVEALMLMLNAMPDAMGANARLLMDKKSIFNLKETLNS
jgi:hypothetical protein